MYQIRLVRHRMAAATPTEVIRVAEGDTAPWKGYAFFAERSEGCALGFKKIASECFLFEDYLFS
ncbi:hypothetical protein, partial [Meiothermus taiwanensis]|uniref:hypothetical protein n=1 Tax=Meiothermus taiwanensis TaxID=172827 RepID=UPI001CC0BB6A